MRLRKQDQNGDYQFGHGVADFWKDQVDGVGQSIFTRMLLYRGEWFMDISEGMPWGGFPLNDFVVVQGRVLGVGTQQLRDLAIKSRVLDTSGVLGITDYSSTYDPNNRNFSVTMTVDTIYGQANLAILPSAGGFTLGLTPLS